MAISSSGVAGLNQYPVNNQLMRQLLLTAKTRAPFFNGTTAGQLSKNAGTATVKWERIENLAKITSPLAELSGNLALPTRTGVTPTITPLTINMQKYGNTIYLSEELELMSINARASKFMDTLGENAGATYNYILSTVFAGVNASQIRRAGGVATDALTVAAISQNDLRFVHNLINRKGGQKFTPSGYGSTNIGSNPLRASYMGICHVDVEEDVRQIPDFIPVESYGGYTEVLPFEFGYSQGVRWCSTEEEGLIEVNAGSTVAGTAGFRSTGGTNNDVYSSYVYAMDAVGTVGLGENHTENIYMTGDRVAAIDLVYAPPTVSVADAQGEIGVLSWKGWLAGRILNDSWMSRVKTLASNLS